MSPPLLLELLLHSLDIHVCLIAPGELMLPVAALIGRLLQVGVAVALVYEFLLSVAVLVEAAAAHQS